MSIRLNLRCLALLLMFASFSMARGITYVVLWFDTEDYIDPIADDAALRIANDLTSLGVHGTFKVVGEKARVLEQRGRTDVIQALGRHCIGYHSDWHSVQPVPALVLQHLGLLEGAGEFERRQRSGFEDVARIFSVTPACYGQPGVSWAPQSNLALRRMGVHVYLDEGTEVGSEINRYGLTGWMPTERSVSRKEAQTCCRGHAEQNGSGAERRRSDPPRAEPSAPSSLRRDVG